MIAKLCEDGPDGRTPNSDGDELAPKSTGRGGCDDERDRPMPRLLAVLAGNEDAVSRTTGTVCGGGDEREEDCEEIVPVDDLLRRWEMVPEDVF